MPPNNDKQHQPTTGIKYPKHRDAPYKNVDLWLKDKGRDDNAEGFWRIHDKLYDLSQFVLSHPGGPDWIKYTKGTDITEAFEAHHLSSKPENILARFHIKDVKTPRNYPYTFEDDGFYRTLKRNVKETLKELPREELSKTSNYIIDTLLVLAVLLSVAANYFWSYSLGVVAAYCLTCTVVAAHNYFHRMDNFRMHYFDLALMSSREWRISHALSHHLHPNTVADLELSLFEPFLDYRPQEKTWQKRCTMWATAPLIWAMVYHQSAIKRYARYLRTGFANFRLADLLPYTLPLVMYYLGNQTLLASLWMWTFILLLSSFHFGLVGLNAAHHHPDIFHEGDAFRPENERDWGVFQLDAVMDRHDINGNHFLVLTNFGEHALHHLFPTLDHAVLEQLWPVFSKTMKQFNIDLRLSSQINLIKGQFQQLAKTVPTSTAKYCDVK